MWTMQIFSGKAFGTEVHGIYCLQQSSWSLYFNHLERRLLCWSRVSRIETIRTVLRDVIGGSQVAHYSVLQVLLLWSENHWAVLDRVVMWSKLHFKCIKERLYKGVNSQVSRLEVGKSVRRLLQTSRLEMLVAPTTEILEWGNWEELVRFWIYFESRDHKILWYRGISHVKHDSLIFFLSFFFFFGLTAVFVQLLLIEKGRLWEQYAWVGWGRPDMQF